MDTVMAKEHQVSVMGIRGRLLLGFDAILMMRVLAIVFIWAKIAAAEDLAKKVINSSFPAYVAFLECFKKLKGKYGVL